MHFKRFATVIPGHRYINVGKHTRTLTNPENTAGGISVRTDDRDRKTYLGILECFVFSRKRRLNGMRRRFNVAYTPGSTDGSTQVFLSVVPIRDKYHRHVNSIHTRKDGSRSSRDHACDFGPHTDVCTTRTGQNRSGHRIDEGHDRRHFKRA